MLFRLEVEDNDARKESEEHPGFFLVEKNVDDLKRMIVEVYENKAGEKKYKEVPLMPEELVNNFGVQDMATILVHLIEKTSTLTQIVSQQQRAIESITKILNNGGNKNVEKQDKNQ